MNTDAIVTKYWEHLRAVTEITLDALNDDAILLALRLAVQETADANAALVNDTSAIIANLRQQELIPESALATAQNEAAMLRQQLAIEHTEVNTLIAEIEQLRQEIITLDADNADLTMKLIAANVRTAAVPDTIHVNGNGMAPAIIAPDDDSDLAAYWESLDKGRRTFRNLPKHVRLDLVQSALNVFAELPTQAAFNAAKPEWMPTAASLCQTFHCTWPELPTLTPEKMLP